MDFRIERQITAHNDCVVAKSSFCAVIAGYAILFTYYTNVDISMHMHQLV